MGTEGSHTENRSLHHRRQYGKSCKLCRVRKVKCDKGTPCSNCAASAKDCVYLKPMRQRRDNSAPEGIDRLRNSFQGSEGSLDGSRTLLPSTPGQRPVRSFGHLAIKEERSRYMSDRFWVSLADEATGFRDGLQLPPAARDEYSEKDLSPLTHFSTNHSFFVSRYPVHLLRKFHPPADKAFLMWNFFQQNVSPLVPILHRPTASNIIRNMYERPQCLSPDSEALLLVIYLAAVISMTKDQCLTYLGIKRATCIQKFRFAVEQALSKAGLPHTDSLVLLQAAALYLTCIRREDASKFTSSMTSLILRLAQGLGLHRDGTLFGLNTFETEMRRRLWWHIYILDIRASEDQGIARQIQGGMFDTHLPSNINDEDIVPELDKVPQKREGFTDVTFLLVRCEISRAFSHATSNGANTMPSQSDANVASLDWFHRIRQYIEEKYLRIFDLSVPIQWVCATTARLIFSKYWIITRYSLPNSSGSTTSTSCAERSRLLALSLEVLKYSHLLEQHLCTGGWAWLFQSYIQWHAVALILSELCVLPRSPRTEQAWALISVVFDTWESDTSQKGSMLWEPIMKMKEQVDASLRQQLSATDGNRGNLYPILPCSPKDSLGYAGFIPPGQDNVLPDVDWLSNTMLVHPQDDDQAQNPTARAAPTFFDQYSAIVSMFDHLHETSGLDSIP